MTIPGRAGQTSSPCQKRGCLRVRRGTYAFQQRTHVLCFCPGVGWETVRRSCLTFTKRQYGILKGERKNVFLAGA